MEEQAKFWSIRVHRRGAMLATAAVPLAEMLLPDVARADIFGDVGVLLAQLEQQIQMVSHAIATVQNLVQTVTHLSNVVKATKTAIQKAGSGGLENLLDGLQELTSVARGATGQLRRIDNDAIWWTAQIERFQVADKQMTTAQSLQTQQAIREMDQRRIQNLNNVNTSYGHLKNSYDALDASNSAVKEAMTTDGITGQMQLLGRQNAQIALIATGEHETMTTMSQATTDELARQSAEREVTRQMLQKDATNFGITTSSSPVTLPYEAQ